MINLLIGPPGGGKSYEAVVYHVLPTLEQGRKVITNLSIDLEHLASIEPRARTLLEVRNRQGTAGTPGSWSFGTVDDYTSDWRHPDTQQGPLFVIDEAHKPLARRTQFQRDPNGTAVDEWYAEHRHTGADILLMTQSYGKLSKAIVDQVQICYRVKKKTAFGDSGGYIRKVQDGVRGDVLSIAERTYEKRHFPLYKSHTRTESAVMEADAKDVSPAFLKWKRAGYAVIALGVVGLIATLASSFTSGDAEAMQQPTGGSARTKEHAAAAGSAVQSPPATSSPDRPARASLRLVGIYQGTPATSHAVVYDGETEKRVPLYYCGRTPFEGWICNIDGSDVTFHTGPTPQAPGGGLAAKFLGD